MTNINCRAIRDEGSNTKSSDKRGRASDPIKRTLNVKLNNVQIVASHPTCIYVNSVISHHSSIHSFLSTSSIRASSSVVRDVMEWPLPLDAFRASQHAKNRLSSH